MIDKDDRDWLDIASDVPTKKDMRVPDDKRPSSEGSLREKSTPNLNGKVCAKISSVENVILLMKLY